MSDPVTVTAILRTSKSCVKSTFLQPIYPPPTDIVITMSGRAAMFRFRRISLKPLVGLLSYYIHTSLNPFTTEARFCVLNAMAFSTQKRSSVVKGLRGVDVPFGGFDLVFHL